MVAKRAWVRPPPSIPCKYVVAEDDVAVRRKINMTPLFPRKLSANQSKRHIVLVFVFLIVIFLRDWINRADHSGEFFAT
jgi:hypothetical protein